MKRRSHERKKRSSRTKKKPAAKQQAAPTTPEHPLAIGLHATVEKIVPQEWTIQAYDPNLPAVFSTPAMIGMLEMAASQAVRPELPPGAITVGTRIEVDHLKAVPVGATVRATARLAKYEGRFLVFDVEAHSGEHLIGSGRVFRALVDPSTHMDKARSRTGK